MTARHALLGTLGSGLLGALLAIPCFFSPLFDDAFIHARIAEQLAYTGSAAFNPGVLLKTDSSTGYLLLLAALSGLTRHAVAALRLLQGASVCLYVVAAYRLSLALVGRLTLLNVLLGCASLPPVLWAAYGGMETSTAALCLTVCATAHVRGQTARALLFASLAACLRIELSPVALYLVVAARGQRVRALVPTWPLAVCLLFDLAAYHTVLPQAARAKSQAYHLPLGEAAQLALSVGFEHHVLLLGLLYVVGFGFWLHGRARSGAALTLRDGLMLESSFLIVAWSFGRSIIFPWYVATFASTICIAAQLSRERTQRFSLSALAIALGVLAGPAVRMDLGFAPDELASGVRAVRYRELAAGLYQHCPACTLASSEIGGLGYAFRGTVLDGLGLADPAALRFHPLAVPEQRSSYRVGALPPGYIALRAPDFVVSMPIFSEAFRRSREVHGYFGYDCPLVPEAPERTLWGDAQIQVFARRALPTPLLTRMRCAPAEAL